MPAVLVIPTVAVSGGVRVGKTPQKKCPQRIVLTNDKGPASSCNENGFTCVFVSKSRLYHYVIQIRSNRKLVSWAFFVVNVSRRTYGQTLKRGCVLAVSCPN